MDPRGIRNYGGVTIAAAEIISSCKLMSTVEDMLNLIIRIFHILVKLRHMSSLPVFLPIFCSPNGGTSELRHRHGADICLHVIYTIQVAQKTYVAIFMSQF
jgi:hypothetical protein